MLSPAVDRTRARWRASHRAGMTTPAERKALLFLALVIALGAGVRMARAHRGTAPDPVAREALLAQATRVDSARRVQRSGETRSPARGRATPRREPRSVPVDLDRAAAPEIEALDGIGAVLARRIVADRDSLGPFGSLAELERVRGIGPRLAKRLKPHVTFSGVARPASADAPGSPPPRRRRATGGSRIP